MHTITPPTRQNSIAVRYHLPSALTPFVNRNEELEQICELLLNPDCRLVTLIGIGGAGKTRLALEAASRCQHDSRATAVFPDGAFFVPPAPATAQDSHEDVTATAIATTLGLTISGPDPATEQVLRYLSGRALLLVLDAYEHTPHGATFVARLLREAEPLKLLVTTRERLGVPGEVVVPIDGLAVPPSPGSVTSLADYPSVALFVQHARNLHPRFVPSDRVLQDVSRICRLLGGLPLGIEIAASWTRTLSCAEIADELSRSLDLLDFSGAALNPQRGLRAVFASSWERLSLPEQAALRRLALFMGRFPRRAAAALFRIGSRERNVHGARILASLVDKSWVRMASNVDEQGVALYLLPDPIRQFAAEQLSLAGESEATANRHSRFYLSFLATQTQRLRGARQQTALAEIGSVIEDVRLAWRRAVARADIPALRRAADSLFHFYDMRSWFHEGEEMFAAAARSLDTAPVHGRQAITLGKVLARQGWFIFYLGRTAEAQALLERSIALLRATEARAELVFPLNYLAAAVIYSGDYLRSQILAEEGLALATELGDLHGQAIACNILSQTAYAQGYHETARNWSMQSLTFEQQTGNSWSMAFSLINLGKVAFAMGEFPAAQRLVAQSLEIRRTTRDLRGMAICYNWLGDIAAAQQARSAAYEHYYQSFQLFQEIGNRVGMAEALLALGRLADDLGQHEATVRLLQEALKHAVAALAQPRVRQILHVFAQTPATQSLPSWEAGLRDLAAQAHDLDLTAVPIMRTLSWATSLVAMSISLEQAFAQLHAGLGSSPQSLAAAGSPNPGQQPVLTARELDVLRLVAQGLTDALVAQELRVSRRTVTTHLTTIYGKLQVKTRTAAVSAASALGLLESNNPGTLAP